MNQDPLPLPWAGDLGHPVLCRQGRDMTERGHRIAWNRPRHWSRRPTQRKKKAKNRMHASAWSSMLCCGPGRGVVDAKFFMAIDDVPVASSWDSPSVPVLQ